MSAKPRGRPRKSIDSELLNAAAEEFLAHGYEAASIDTIAAAAGSTKPALYRRYASKKALFEAVVSLLAKDFEIDLPHMNDDLRPPETVLLELGQFYRRHIGSSKVQALSRLMISERVRFKTLTIDFRERVIQTYLPHLIAYLERLDREGLVRIDDTAEAAVIFATLTGGPLEQLLGVKIKRTLEVAHLREIVRFFLAGHGYIAPAGAGATTGDRSISDTKTGSDTKKSEAAKRKTAPRRAP